MSVLPKPCGAGPPRNEWMIISTRIAGGLEEIRNGFFDWCIRILELDKAGKDRLEIPIVCRILGGEGDLAIKAYQLLLASECIGSYIPDPQANEFAELLYSQICGIKTRETYVYFKRYEESSRSYQHSRFASDVARYISGREPDHIEPLYLARLIPRFTNKTYMVLAEAFGDQARLRELESFEPKIRAFEQGNHA